jgi:hypothetical protein
MATVGEIILGARELVPDRPGTINAPGAEVTAALFVTAGVTLPAGNYRLKLAYENAFGITTPGAEIGPLAVDATHGIQVTGTLPPGVTAIRAYITSAGGAVSSENQYIRALAVPFNITAPGTAEYPPTRNTAYLPDSDGKFASAFTVYRWLNDAMGRASRVCGGGIPDWSGVQSAAGQSVYVLNGVWQKITDVWYDGYLVGKGGKASIFRAGTPTGRPGTISVMHDAQRTIVQVDPAPPRTGGATTLNGALTAVATTASLVASNFSLGKGLAMIGTEIVSYSSNIGGNLAGLVRGLGGTQIQAWPIGTAVVELNLAIAGLRLASTYAPGDASKTFSVPVGWELPIKKYLLSMFREGEQNGREAQRLMKECDMDLAMLLRANRQQAGPVQITPGGAQGPEVVGGLGGPFGGVIVP